MTKAIRVFLWLWMFGGVMCFIAPDTLMSLVAAVITAWYAAKGFVAHAMEV